MVLMQSTGLLSGSVKISACSAHLCNDLADHCCDMDANEDGEFACFDIKLGWEWDDIDLSARADTW